MQNETMEARILEAETLTLGDLLDLIEGRVLALRIRNYYPRDLSGEIARRLLAHPRFGFYANAGDIGRVGMSFFETLVSSELREEYFAAADATMKDLRAACSPYVSPIDRLRVELEELWPSGAQLLRMDGRTMFVGLARVFRGRAEAIPHQDILRRDATNFPLAARLRTQLAGNVYLQPSAEGGELELWGRSYSDDDYDARRWKNSYGLDRARIDPSRAILRPEQGDLILFNATQVHAVRPTLRGTRVTLSCFVGARCAAEPLVYWS